MPQPMACFIVDHSNRMFEVFQTVGCCLCLLGWLVAVVVFCGVCMTCSRNVLLFESMSLSQGVVSWEISLCPMPKRTSLSLFRSCVGVPCRQVIPGRLAFQLELLPGWKVVKKPAEGH